MVKKLNNSQAIPYIIMEQIQVTNNDGHYYCNINITSDEWFELLNDPEITTPVTWKTLLGFYQSPNHSAACSAVNPDNPKSPNPVIRHWGERIQERLKRFQVLPTTGEGYSYWIIPMTGFSKGTNFVWTVRPELVQAIDKVLQIQERLFQEAVKQYKQKLRDDPSYWEGNASEPNQRVAISHFQNTWQNVDNPNEFAQMFKTATAKTGNLLDSVGFPRAMILDFASIQPKQVEDMFRNLFDENIDLKQRVEDFKQKAKALLEIYRSSHPENQKAKSHFQDTNAISTYLWLMYPNKYYKYAYDIYTKNKKILCLYQYDIRRDGTVDSMLEGFAMYDEIRAKLLKDKELVDMINTRVNDLHLEKDFEDDFHSATIDFGYFVSKLFQPNIQQIQENAIMSNNPYQDIVDLLEYKKNIILQGAPGTGKTYSTAAIALGILGVDVDFNDHKAVMEKYEEYRKDKRRIFFTTFHQSMDYEDFVEGLKPELVKESEQSDNSNNTEKNVGVTYVCKRGIFKEACQAARVGQEFSKWLDDFLNSIIGFENKKEIPTATGKSKIYVWWNVGNKTISVRPVTSTREPLDRFVAAPNIEKIKSQATNEEDPEDQEPNWPHYSQAIINYVSKEYGKNIQSDDKNNVVLIIDEINRGNVSRIFGELVTLLEKDKRDDNEHPITVTLPYSKEEFSVPSNVYIIGTMNTTDRSTGTLDYAIRRRFAFVTLKAEEKVISNEKARALFNNIKSFIENKDNHPEDMDIDDLMVGHSYFMAKNEEELKLKIQYEVIPLLKEYFNDGLLTCSQDDLDNHIKSWKELEVYGRSETQALASFENPADASAEAASTDDEEDIEGADNVLEG